MELNFEFQVFDIPDFIVSTDCFPKLFSGESDSFKIDFISLNDPSSKSNKLGSIKMITCKDPHIDLH